MRPHPAAAAAPAILLLALIALLASTAEAQGRNVVLRRGPRHAHGMLLTDPHHTGIAPFEGPQRGEIIWTNTVASGLLATPAVDRHGRSFWATQDGALVVLDPDGATLRRMDLSAPSHSAPALGFDGSIYAADRDGLVIRFSPDGDRIWTAHLDGETVSSPLVDEIARRLYISVQDRTIGIHLDTGLVVFDYSLHNGQYNSSPVLGPDGLIRFANWDGWFVAITPDGEDRFKRRVVQPGKVSTPVLGPFGEAVIASIRGEVLGLTPRGLPRWNLRTDDAVISFLALLPDGRVVVPVKDVGLQTVDLNGRPGWIFPIPTAQLAFTVAVSRSGITYYSTLEGLIGAVDPHGDAVWRLETRHPFASGPVIAPPVRHHPRALIGAQDGTVFCIE